MAIAAKLAEAKPHDAVSCDGTVAMLIKEQDKWTCTFRMSTSGANILMWPVKHEDMECVKPAKESPCVVSDLKAITKTCDLVDIPVEVEVLQYRSLGGHGASEHEEEEPSFFCPKMECVENEDGSKVFKAMIADQILPESEIGTKFATKESYLLAAKNAVWNALINALREHDIALNLLFPCDDTGNALPEATICFMDLLFPYMIPGHDVLIGIPSIKDGEISDSGVFPLCFEFEGDVKRLPFPGLVHNDAGANESGKLIHDEDYFVVSNVPLVLDLCLLLPAQKFTHISPSDLEEKMQTIDADDLDFDAWDVQKKMFINIISRRVNESLGLNPHGELYLNNLYGIKHDMMLTSTALALHDGMDASTDAAKADFDKRAKKAAGPQAEDKVKKQKTED